MTELVIRPTAKFLIVRFVVTAIVYIALVIWWWQSLRPRQEGTDFLPVLGLLAFLPALRRWVEQRFTKATVVGERLRYETGMMSKTTRTIELSRLQDVTVQQAAAQRMFGVGDLSIETSGETSRLTITNVDAPQAVADELLNRAKEHR